MFILGSSLLWVWMVTQWIKLFKIFTALRNDRLVTGSLICWFELLHLCSSWYSLFHNLLILVFHYSKLRQCSTNRFSHMIPGISFELYCQFILKVIVEANGGLNCVCIWDFNLFKHDTSAGASFLVIKVEWTTIISERCVNFFY